MLSNEELTSALIINLSEWDWDIYSKFPLDQKTSDALIAEYKRLVSENNEMKKRIEANRFLGGLK